MTQIQMKQESEYMAFADSSVFGELGLNKSKCNCVEFSERIQNGDLCWKWIVGHQIKIWNQI